MSADTPDERSEEGVVQPRLVRLPSKERGCSGKMRISLKESPHLKAQELAKKHGKDFGVYRCPYCDKYHLTTKLSKQADYYPLEYQTNFFEANGTSEPPAKTYE